MFESAKLKIIRANQHLLDFEARFAEYVVTNPHRFSIYNDPESGQPKIRIRFESDRTYRRGSKGWAQGIASNQSFHFRFIRGSARTRPQGPLIAEVRG